MSIARDMVQHLAHALDAAAMTGLYFKAADDEAAPGVPVRFLLRHPGVRDEAIVNAYGVNAQILTFAAEGPFAAVAPEKFDRVVQAGALRYVFDAVLRRSVGDVVIGYTAYVRGKGGA